MMTIYATSVMKKRTRVVAELCGFLGKRAKRSNQHTGGNERILGRETGVARNNGEQRSFHGSGQK